MSKRTEAQIKTLLLKKIEQKSPDLYDKVEVTVVTDETWNRHSCKFDVGDVTTEWMFITMNLEDSDFQFDIDHMVSDVIMFFRIKGIET
jgi:hypothetical protein